MSETWLHGLHDVDGAELMEDRPGWIVVTLAIGHNPKDTSGANFYAWTSRGYKILARLNNAHNGVDGTIPAPEYYDDFAKRCAIFVSASPGISACIIGNEPNTQTEWPHGQKISAANYANCFRKCFQAIKAVNGNVPVLVAGCAPWNNQSGDWLAYFRQVLDSCGICDGFACHAYTHGSDPALITSEEMQHGWHWQFRVYQDQCEVIQLADLEDLPMYLTETDQNDPWLDSNNGWVEAAYNEINTWNQSGRKPLIHALCLYRSNQDDQWSFYAKSGVQQGFRNAVEMGFMVPMSAPPPTPLPDPTPIFPEPEEEGYLQYWDMRLDIRGTQLILADAENGQYAWRIVMGQYYPPGDSPDQAQGRHSIYLSVMDEFGNLMPGVPVRFFNGGDVVKPTEIKSDPWLGGQYSIDYPMYEPAPAYGFQIDNGEPSDIVQGLGLGSLQAPHMKEHSAYFFAVQRLPTKTPQPPEPPTPSAEVETGYVTAPAGLNLRALPSTNTEVLGILAYGSTVLWDDEQAGWLHVVDGWVASEYVADVPDSHPAPPPTPGASDLSHPLPGSFVTQNFYENPDAYAQFDLPGHDGCDFGGMPAGTPVLAMADGKVMRADYDASGYGNFILLYHPQLFAYTLYGHASDLLVRVGEQVIGGEPIMSLGATGNAIGVHLHLEWRMANADGSYREDTPMRRGRVDPRTVAAQNGLEL